MTNSSNSNPKSKKANGVIETHIMEFYRNIVDSSSSHEQIRGIMAAYGYSDEELAKGKAKYSTTADAIGICIRCRSEYLTARGYWNDKYTILKKEYMRHRNLSRILFGHKNPEYNLLKLTQQGSKSYGSMIQSMRHFYDIINEEQPIIDAFSKVNVSSEDLLKGKADVAEVDEARTSVLKHSAKSQQATLAKNTLKADLEKWISKYIKLARIAMAEQPQLLEALGIVVKS